MTEDRRLLNDVARVASGAAGTVFGLRAEVEARLKAQVERILTTMDLVPREEFEAVKAMAIKAREENAALAARLDALESGAQKPVARKASAKKPAPKKT